MEPKKSRWLQWFKVLILLDRFIAFTWVAQQTVFCCPKWWGMILTTPKIEKRWQLPSHGVSTTLELQLSSALEKWPPKAMITKRLVLVKKLGRRFGFGKSTDRWKDVESPWLKARNQRARRASPKWSMEIFLPFFVSRPVWWLWKHPDVKFGFAETRQQKRMASFWCTRWRVAEFFFWKIRSPSSKNWSYTVGERNPAPVDMENIPFS